MVFSSITFIYYFLPLALILYYIVPKKFKNNMLLLLSILFYFYGEKHYVILLLLSCLVNYIFGIVISKSKNKIPLIIGITFNLLLILYFKYTNFFITTFKPIFNINTLNIVLPLGISFFTFQNISYLVDVYRKDVECERNLFDYATYITFFPQLIAGPIVRYKDIKSQLTKREHTTEMFSNGIRRFTLGLSKKVLIANTIYSFITVLNDIPNKSSLTYILLSVSYTLNIYFDFSGYSDMAIGLAKMFGINLLENFNYPLIANSITDFWRRWHISLSSFFKDYVYIPLGGNRCSKIKWLRNILIVWLLTGFWHGANWNFIIWGLFFFIVLLLEKLFISKHLTNKIISHIYSLVLILISFTIFSITDLNELILFFKGMFTSPLINTITMYNLKNYILILLISCTLSTPLIRNIIRKISSSKYGKIIDILEPICLLILLVLSTSSLISSSFNPFIYFRF